MRGHLDGRGVAPVRLGLDPALAEAGARCWRKMPGRARTGVGDLHRLREAEETYQDRHHILGGDSAVKTEVDRNLPIRVDVQNPRLGVPVVFDPGRFVVLPRSAER